MTREFTAEEIAMIDEEVYSTVESKPDLSNRDVLNHAYRLILRARAERDAALAKLREWEGGKINWTQLEADKAALNQALARVKELQAELQQWHDAAF